MNASLASGKALAFYRFHQAVANKFLHAPKWVDLKVCVGGRNAEVPVRGVLVEPAGGSMATANDGAGGRTRTDMSLTSPDFESGAYTNFATPASRGKIISRVIVESQTEEVGRGVLT